MLDLVLTYHLLKPLQPGTQVLFVGDVDQLHRLELGCATRYHHQWRCTGIAVEDHFRQSHDSQIVAKHMVNRGQMPIFSKTQDGDFFFSC